MEARRDLFAFQLGLLRPMNVIAGTALPGPRRTVNVGLIVHDAFPPRRDLVRYAASDAPA